MLRVGMPSPTLCVVRLQNPVRGGRGASGTHSHAERRNEDNI